MVPLVSQAPVRQAPPEHSWNKPLMGEDSLGTDRERGEETTSSGLCELTEKTDSEPHGPDAGPSAGTAVAARVTGALPAWGLRQAPLTLLSAQKVGKWAFQVDQIACLAVDRATL